jgi:hypothetical protein
MTITLSREDSQRWEQGGWLSLEIQETILEDLERQRIAEAVAVVLAGGAVAFWVSSGVVI